MSVLIPIPASDLTVQHDFLSRNLTIRAGGEISDNFKNPFIQRELFCGGLRFSVRAFPQVGVPVQVPLNIKYTEKMNLLPGMESVIIETGLGTFTVPINLVHLGAKESALSDGVAALSVTDAATNTAIAMSGDVLPPIHCYLPSEAILSITADIPATTVETKTAVNISFDPDWFTLLSANVVNGSIAWTFKWAKVPTDSDNPQLIDVLTDRFNNWGNPLNPAQVSRIIQGYVVEHVYFEQKKA
ncbi:hypothetical protein HD806DRAFT_493469 [Xylariaceae sp. AK1471]|nr:hypothetical protein HD806DRAFT_493469 [Xylariaceae sp. AK1471]